MEIDIDPKILADYRKNFVNNLQSGMDSESVQDSFLANTQRNLNNYNSWIHQDEPLRVYEKKDGMIISTQPHTMYSNKGHFYVTKEELDLKELVGDLVDFGLSNQGVYRTARSFLYASNPYLNEILSIDSIEAMIAGGELKKGAYLEIYCLGNEVNNDLAEIYLEKFRDKGYAVDK
ncbi:MAG: hypothetical protein KAT28_03350 [Candidatus Aenigmarchaeota archaeon]|nr:hypothetical protein [Candidatus Aenigmarchaeota archaeon]